MFANLAAVFLPVIVAQTGGAASLPSTAASPLLVTWSTGDELAWARDRRPRPALLPGLDAQHVVVCAGRI